MGMGPSSRETTLHHFRDPLTEVLAADTEIDFTGIVLQGTPEVCDNKQFIARRTGVLMENMRIDGAVVSIDSWGNSHVDFTSVLEALGERHIPLVGMSFVGTQAAFVVTNPYMDTIIDFNKTNSGIETSVVAENSVALTDAVKADVLLKNKIRKQVSDCRSSALKEKILRSLCIRHFAVDTVRFGDATAYADGKLTLRSGMEPAILARYPGLRSMRVSIVEPGKHDFPVNSILDFCPIATKTQGRPGQGFTHVFDGAYVMLTGVEKCGVQPANIGCATGILRDTVKLGMRGTPDKTDSILHVDVTFEDGFGRTREGIFAAHYAADEVMQEIRAVLRSTVGSYATAKATFHDTARPGLPRVVLIKLISGLGWMYDTGVFPHEPCGAIGIRPILSLANMQVAITPNEYRDGVVCCL